MSINFLLPSGLHSHWEAVEKGAARTGRKVSRSQWRIAREIYVADTTAQARKEALHNSMARSFQRYFRLVLNTAPPGLAALKKDSSMPDDALTPEYMLDNLWIVGDPEECARQLRQLYQQVGGFGTVLMICHDWDDKRKWLHSMELLAKEVMPKLGDLT
jgi:alkanesulfonate monooxygenase SsuD/methylene tetrahydromethanopterin reductase-like flavin-dependent oxidoreductase (luciferase family)